MEIDVTLAHTEFCLLLHIQHGKRRKGRGLGTRSRLFGKSNSKKHHRQGSAVGFGLLQSTSKQSIQQITIRCRNAQEEAAGYS